MTQDSDYQSFLPPESLFGHEPPGIRAVAIEQYGRDFMKRLESTKEELVRALMEKNKIDRLEASTQVLHRFIEIRKTFSHEAASLSDPLGATLSHATDEEQAGNINKAVQLYEELGDNGFLGSMPYDRLRIIYTKQGSYLEAIRICKRYIEVMQRVENYWPQYASTKQISQYQDHIKKLSGKLKKSGIGDKSARR